MMKKLGTLCLMIGVAAAPAGAGLVNFETPPIHPLEITPDVTTLLVANTAAGRMEVFDITLGSAVPRASIPVGIDPVSVRARSATEAWVVNHLSASRSATDRPGWRWMKHVNACTC